MKLPNAAKAVIAPAKLRDYLLNPDHRRGSGKAKLLFSMGYRTATWQNLETDIRDRHLSEDILKSSTSMYGERFEIVAPLIGPNGKEVTFRSVWQIDIGKDTPRLITMYAE